MHPPPPTERVPDRLRLWSLSEDVLLEVGPPDEDLVAVTRWGEIRIADASPPVRESLQRMSLGPVWVRNLPIRDDSSPSEPAGTAGPPSESWDRLRRVLDLLACCVVQSLGLDDETGPVLSVVPVSRLAKFLVPGNVEPDRPVRLSRFAAMRAGDGGLVLESPVTRYRVILHRPAAAWVVGSLGSATTITAIAAQLKIAVPVVADIVAYLVASGVVLTGEPGSPPLFAEDSNPELMPWGHHDLLFHARSRMGRHNGPSGAVFPYLDRLPPAPVTRAQPEGPRYPLRRPVLADIAASDLTLTAVTEAGPSTCEYSEQPVTADQLGELLFRVARVRSTKEVPAAGGATYAISDRPYHSTGGLYELELYLSLDRCAGLPRGSYHYDPLEHTLTMISDTESELAELMDIAKAAAGNSERPPVLITAASRLARLSWMYSGIAYATTLKHVGALQQTLSLVATAMGLVACPLAVGDGAVMDEALRLEWPAEVSVGEFALGVPR